MPDDEITLTLPRERPFYAVAELVLGGLAARHDVTLEHLEDLELALDGVLDRLEGAEPATVRLRVAGSELVATLGPIDGAVKAELEREAGEQLSLRRLLDAVVDRYELVERDGADWLALTKTVS